MANQKLPQTLVSIAALFLMVANMALSKTTHFAVPPALTFQGDAFDPNDTSFIRLTTSHTWSVGRVMYSKPLTFWGEGKQVHFKTKISFNITSIAGNKADGVALFMVPVGPPIPNGGAGGNLGLFDSSGVGKSIFAVKFDTHANVWDPPCRHIGINVNSRVPVAHKCMDDSVNWEDVTLSINYDEADKIITVRAQVGLTKHYDLSHKLDLSTILEKKVQVGLSASTGTNIALHDINYWEFTANMICDSDSDSVDGAGIRQLVST
uniref:Lectin n=1 Tax=Glechoma hederacea TaxID=28509 RepID=Q8H218_GLEHE|nr:lectin [Glechoma hederacea]